MGRSISQFLGFARPFELEIAPCEARLAARRAHELCETVARRKNVAFEVEEQGELPPMQADAGKLAQAIANVAGNAIDAVAEGGHVTIVVSRQGADIQYDILDDGPGILPPPRRRSLQAVLLEEGGRHRPRPGHLPPQSSPPTAAPSPTPTATKAAPNSESASPSRKAPFEGSRWAGTMGRGFPRDQTWMSAVVNGTGRGFGRPMTEPADRRKSA